MTQSNAKPLGLLACTALVVGNMIGSGVFLLPASLAPYGGLAILGWVVTALGAALLALVFARLARALPEAGGPYAYTHAAFGNVTAFLIAWGYWIAQWSGNAAIAVALVSYLDVFVPGLGESGVLSGVVAIAAVWLVTAVNLRGVGVAGNLQVITTVLKLLPLLAVATIGLLWVRPADFPPFNPSAEPPFAALSGVAALTLWSFLGLESATVPAGAVTNPSRTIPRATLLGMALTALVYILSTVTVFGVVRGEQLAASPAPFAEAAGVMWGGWASYAVAVGAAISCLGALNGFMLITSQVSLAAARDGLFPTPFARLSARNTPTFGLVVPAALITALLVLNYSGSSSLAQIFQFIILLATLSTLIPYAVCAMADLLLTLLGGADTTRGQLIRSAAITGLAFAYTLWTIYGAGAETVLYGVLLLLLGLPVYVWQRVQHTPASKRTTAGSVIQALDD